MNKDLKNMNKVTVKTLLLIGFLLPQLIESSVKRAALPTAKPVSQIVAPKAQAAKPSLKTAPPVKITIPAQLQDISFGSNNTFTGYHELRKALNNGETFTGTVVSDGTKDSGMMLTLKSATSTITATGTFWTKNQINYFCTGDKAYTYSAILNPGTTVTIIGAKGVPPVLITSNLSDIYLFDTSRRDFTNKTALINAINKGETFFGTINSNKVLTLKSLTSATIATSTCITEPNQIYYKAAGDLDFKNIPVASGTMVTIVGVGGQSVIDILKSNQSGHYDVYDIFMGVAPKSMKVGGISGSSVDISSYSYATPSDGPCFNFFKSGCFEVTSTNGCSGVSINDGLYIDDIQIKFPKPLNLGESDAIVIYIHVGPAATLSHNVIPTASIGKIYLNGISLKKIDVYVNNKYQFDFLPDTTSFPLNFKYYVTSDDWTNYGHIYTYYITGYGPYHTERSQNNQYLSIRINNLFIVAGIFEQLYTDRYHSTNSSFTIYP